MKLWVGLGSSRTGLERVDKRGRLCTVEHASGNRTIDGWVSRWTWYSDEWTQTRTIWLATARCSERDRGESEPKEGRMVVVREREWPEGFGRGDRVFIGRMGEADLNHTARHGMSAIEGLRRRCFVENGNLPVMDW